MPRLKTQSVYRRERDHVKEHLRNLIAAIDVHLQKLKELSPILTPEQNKALEPMISLLTLQKENARIKASDSQYFQPG